LHMPSNVSARIREPYKPHRDHDSRVNSARAAITHCLAFPSQVSDAHRREILSVLIWKLTEVDGKYRTRYRSAGVLSAEIVPIEHEHVVTRKELIDRLIAEPHRCDQILDEAIGCLVTKAEHKRLKDSDAANPNLRGWARYRAAGIVAIDMADGNEVQW